MSKIKIKGGGTPEVHSARSKLDGVLQNLVDKKEESILEDSPEARDSDFERESLPNTPTKRGIKIGRKRKRGRDDNASPDINQYHHTYVMKLFDRSLDLAQFEDRTSLYTICRAWMKNQPHNRNLNSQERTPTPDPNKDEIDNDTVLIYQLPKPLNDHEGIEVDSRIPKPLPQPGEHLDINTDPSQAPPAEQLLIDHMSRWKEIRKTWKDASSNYEAKYGPALELLREMYDAQCKE